MNTERLLREVERRLAHLADGDRAEVLDALREEIAHGRRHLSGPGRVEEERERRVEAETLREILEAINRQASLEQTIEEVLKQLARIVVLDSCSVALVEDDGRFRIIASRGFADAAAVTGSTFKDELSDALRQSTSPIALADVAEDERFEKIAGTGSIRSWAGIPLLVEGEVIGLLSLDRHQVEPFDDDDLHRAKAVAFSAAAAIRKGQLLHKVRRYAALMEQLVQVDQAVFAGQSPDQVAQRILEGALRVGPYTGGLLVLGGEGAEARVAAVSGDLDFPEGTGAPGALMSPVTTWLPPSQAEALGLPAEDVYLVPLATAEKQLGSLVLVDPDGQTPDDRLMDAYASRAAAAYLHATRQSG